MCRARCYDDGSDHENCRSISVNVGRAEEPTHYSKRIITSFISNLVDPRVCSPMSHARVVPSSMPKKVAGLEVAFSSFGMAAIIDELLDV